ncbi:MULTISPECIES: peptidoglycan editing factor PgeF [Cyanophyceae]|uniref:peptidoglycan editing factor PgeF n=1 Tax=Cyanophyceae TaxID=3028117 RepID=UPI0016849060|nr:MULTISPECIES: peptidoglycan editing factor PgeF [Cyanophyceae]MBD1914539.1 peptidoglycan editing factor PgeF [Phormidium sp. FACHB-77]MBD2029685.1 peptidoglycan editing factor PgeF [Phormidium sp. FACHB-322]MBD2049329.1 peptidoglycan editing factor PgeF [Leptolyngbya sp. FACHB-60]
MANWHWQTWQGQVFLTCDLLQDWPHGFFTRQFWPQTPEVLTAALDATAAVQRVKQVHGNRVLVPADLPGPDLEKMAEADGLLSDRPGQALWVCSADCSPVLVGDRATGQVSAIHAGWRGTAQSIVAVAVDQMQAQGSRLEDLVVAIGPAIAGEIYQVSVEVAAAVGRTITPQTSSNDEAVVAELQQRENSPVLGDDVPSKARLDVRLANRWQLEQLGLSREQVAIAPHCTFQEPDRFFSYRRTGEKQVQWSGIVSQGPGSFR